MAKGIPWDDIKRDYDAGLTDAELQNKYNVKHTTLRSHRKRNNWGTHNTLTKIGSKSAAKTKSKLTAEEVYFCELYARSVPQYKAYQLAFNRSNMSNSAASNAGSHLRRRPEIANKINEVIRNSAKARKWSFGQYVDDLFRVYGITLASIEEDGARKANTDAFVNISDRLMAAFQLDPTTNLKNEALKMKIKLFKAKLQAESSADDAQLEQVNKLLDEIDKQL